MSGQLILKKDLFTMAVIVQRMLSTQDFKTDVGIESNSHDFGEVIMIFRTFALTLMLI